jgi:hypothetical protein
MSKQKKFKTMKERKKEKLISYNNNVFVTLTEFFIAGMKLHPGERGRRIVLEDNTGR